MFIVFKNIFIVKKISLENENKSKTILVERSMQFSWVQSAPGGALLSVHCIFDWYHTCHGFTIVDIDLL